MKILFIAPANKINAASGAATHLSEVLTNLSNANEVILIARSDSHIINKSFKFYRVKIIQIPLLNVLSSSIHAFFIGLNVIKNSNVDIIYERNHSFGTGVLLGKIMKIPTIIEVNGLTSEEANTMKLYGKIIQKIVKKLEKMAFLNATKIIAVTNGIKQILYDEYDIPKEKIEVIQNGVNIDLFKPIETTTSRKYLNLNSDLKYICFVGNLLPWQGVEYLIHAAQLIAAKCSNARFLIVGDGVMKSELIQLASKMYVADKFIFTGSVPYEQVPHYINASDLCVAPFLKARNEKIGLSPLKLYEYMACGKPVIASNIKGVGDVLALEQAGIAVPPENSDELATAVIKLLQYKNLRKQMGTNGRKYVVENHSWASVAKKVADVCENTIAD